MDSFNDLIASPLQRQALIMGVVAMVVSYLISVYVGRFRRSLKVEQVVNVRLGSENVRPCRVLRLPSDGFTVVVVDLKDHSVRFVSREQIYLR